MTTFADDKLEQFLTTFGLEWSYVSTERHVALCNEWEAAYGNFRHWIRRVEGRKAQFEYSHLCAETFMVVPFLGNVAGPQSIYKPGARKAAYECHGDGALPDLSAFADIDFFIVPADWSWTMMHTHEDYGMGGLYLVRRDWVRESTRKRSR